MRRGLENEPPPSSDTPTGPKSELQNPNPQEASADEKTSQEEKDSVMNILGRTAENLNSKRSSAITIVHPKGVSPETVTTDAIGSPEIVPSNPAPVLSDISTTLVETLSSDITTIATAITTAITTTIPLALSNAAINASNIINSALSNVTSTGSLSDSPVVIVINNPSEDSFVPTPTDVTLSDVTLGSNYTSSPKLDTMKSDAKEALISEGLLFLVVVVAASLFAAHICRKLRIRSIQMPTIATLFGMIIGAILKFRFSEHTILERILAFDDDVFFVLLLPPIIFESGFSLSGTRAHEFFRNFGTILCFAFITTTMSFVLVGTAMFFSGLLQFSMPLTIRESFAFGALISSTDPVSVLGIFKDLNANPTLAAIVSGESLLNDAISIVLYRIIADESNSGVGSAILSFTVVFLSSMTIGILIGLLSALIYRFMDLQNEENQMLESALLLLFPWSSYLIADGFVQSGIVSILFCGMTMGKYTYPNMSEKAKQSSISMFGTLALLAETVVFVLLGIAVFSFPQQQLQIGLLVCTLIFVSLSRITSVVCTARFVNLFRRSNHLSTNFQLALTICGLRGAIAFALALRARHDFGGINGTAILSASLFYALFTIVIIGSSLVCVFDRLDVFTGESEQHSYTVINENKQSLGYLKRAIVALDARIFKIFSNSGSLRSGSNHNITFLNVPSNSAIGVIELQTEVNPSDNPHFTDEDNMSSFGTISTLGTTDTHSVDDLQNDTRFDINGVHHHSFRGDLTEFSVVDPYPYSTRRHYQNGINSEMQDIQSVESDVVLSPLSSETNTWRPSNPRKQDRRSFPPALS